MVIKLFLEISEKVNINDYKFITIVRNPYDRFISAFYYLKNGGDFDKKNINNKKYFLQYDLNEFIDILYNETINKRLVNCRTKNNNYFINIIHFKPMYIFCNIEKMNDIIYFENLNENTLQNIDNKIKDKLVIKNKSNHLNYKEYFKNLDKLTIYKFNEIYSKDFELFNYNKIIQF